MPTRIWTLTDVFEDVYVDQLAIAPHDVGGAAHGYSVRKRRLHGGRREGVDLIEVDNGRLRFSVVPTRGMGLWRASCEGVELGWRSPVHGPVHPQFVPLGEPTGLGWLAGFDELVCRCGLESNGAPVFDDGGRLQYGLHGRIANLPAHHVQVAIDGDRGEIAVSGVVDEARLYHTKLRLISTVRTRVGAATVEITDEVVNCSAEPAELSLLYHINFGAPLLEEDACAVVPIETLVPCNARAVEGLATWDRYGPPQAGFDEQVYFCRLAADADGATGAMLHNAAGDRGVRLRFNRAQLPWFTIWKSTQMPPDGYVTGLEPGTNLPNDRWFESQQGRLVTLAGGERRTFELTMECLTSRNDVEAAERSLHQLTGSQPPEICPQPESGWSAQAS